MNNEMVTRSATMKQPTTGHWPPATVIGIDVGGTKIAAGLVDVTTGMVTDKRVIPTRPERGGEAVLADVISLARALLKTQNSQLRTVIGLGVCELVNLQGDVTSEFTIAWKGVPVQAALSEIAPATVEADVRAHALAEATFGAGRGYDIFAFVTVGTGISSCLVQHGRPFAGARGNALVLSTAPLTVPLDGDMMVSHVMETYSSGPAIAARYGNGATRAEDVFAAAVKGDARAIHVLKTAGESLGNSVGFLVNILDPEAVIVGGGLGMADGLYWDSFIASTRRHIWSETTRDLPILHAALGPDAGLIGAAATIFLKFPLVSMSEASHVLHKEKIK